MHEGRTSSAVRPRGSIHLQATVDVPAAGTTTYTLECGQVGGGTGFITNPNLSGIYLPNRY